MRINKVFILLLLFIIIAIEAASQFTVKFIATVPVNTDNIYLAGTFNKWVPGNKNYKLKPLDKTHRQITIPNFSSGPHEFKFTRGVWSTVETSFTGQDIRNRFIYINSDTTLYLKIEQWADAYINISNFSDSLTFVSSLSRAEYYLDRNQDSSYKYVSRLKELSPVLRSKNAESIALNMLGLIFARQGNRDKALELYLKALSIKQHLLNPAGVSYIYQNIAAIYQDEGDYLRAKETYLKSVKVMDTVTVYFTEEPLTKIGECYFNLGNIDSARYYLKQALKVNINHSPALLVLGDIEIKRGNRSLALSYKKKALDVALNFSNNLNTVAEALTQIAKIFMSFKEKDSAFYYARKSLNISNNIKNPITIINSCEMLIDLFAGESRFDSAFYYQNIVSHAKDSLFTREKERELHNIYFNETLRQQELKAQNEKYASQKKIYLLGSVSLLLLMAAAFVFYHFRTKQIIAMYKIRSIISRDLHDEVGSTLSSISIMNEMAKTKSNGNASINEKIADNLQKVQNSMDDIVWSVNPKNDDLDHLLLRFSEVARDMLEPKGIAYNYHAPEMVSFKLAMEQRREIYLIYKECLNNIVKHSNCSLVIIDFSVQKRIIKLIIKDNGTGFQPELAINGNGLKNIKARAKKLSASININTTIGAGSSIELIIPIS